MLHAFIHVLTSFLSVVYNVSSVLFLLPSSLLDLLLTGHYPNPWRPITRSQVELVGMGSQLSVDCTTPGEGMHAEYVLTYLLLCRCDEWVLLFLCQCTVICVFL